MMDAVGIGEWCDVCDGARVMIPKSYEPRSDELYWDGTVRKVLSRLEAGDVRYLRYDVPVEDMAALAASDLKYTIVAFLRCERCGRERFMGLCVRGQPIYRAVDEGSVDRWEWEPVPDESLWRS